MSKIFDCYFCGGETDIEKSDEWVYADGSRSSPGFGGKLADKPTRVDTDYWVMCCRCMASGPMIKNDKRKAIKTWNQLGVRLQDG